MKKTITIAIAVLMISSCCKKEVVEYHAIVEKITSQSQGGGTIYYNLLLADGTEVRVSSAAYARLKVGETYPQIKCVD